jgi:hypothetical protein
MYETQISFKISLEVDNAGMRPIPHLALRFNVSSAKIEKTSLTIHSLMKTVNEALKANQH